MTKTSICALFIALQVLPIQCFSANWLMLQGGEAPDAPRYRLWGFAQVEHQSIMGEKTLSTGAWRGSTARFNLVGPEFDEGRSVELRRARVGLRGRLTPWLNYFFLSEFGNNGVTNPNGNDHDPQLTDASITISPLRGFRLRLGQFKFPGSEEAWTAQHASAYINFTNMTAQLLQERFFDSDGSAACTRALRAVQDCRNFANGSFGAFRDLGIEVFETFVHEGWEYSYAFMVGNGNGLTRWDNDDNKDIYAYLSTEKVFGGKGPFRDSWKLYVWMQEGKRELKLPQRRTWNRDRRGVGTTFRGWDWRFAAEYVDADGMIFSGSDSGVVPGTASADGALIASNNVAPDESAYGWYVQAGRQIHPMVELNVRYDEGVRGTKLARNRREAETWTLGVLSQFAKSSRVIVNYEFRKASAPDFSAGAVPSVVADSIGDRLTFRYQFKF